VNHAPLAESRQEDQGFPVISLLLQGQPFRIGDLLRHKAGNHPDVDVRALKAAALDGSAANQNMIAA
jgi:hypothetical protein